MKKLSHIKNILDITRDSHCQLLFSFEIHSLFLFNKRLIEEIFFCFVILVAIMMSPLIIILVFLKFHQHSWSCLDIMNLSWCDLCWRLHSWLVMLSESSSWCQVHLLSIVSKVRRSSNLLSLLILNHHVAYYSELLGFRGCKNSATLPYYHLRIVILLTNFARLK